jgi:hypothetical protein
MMEALVFAFVFAFVFAVPFAILGEENLRAIFRRGPGAFLRDRQIMRQREAIAQHRARMPKPVGVTAIMSGGKLEIRRP